jgi:rod shape determining protein RodA
MYSFMNIMFSILKGHLIGVRLLLLICSLLLVVIGILTIYAVGHPSETSLNNNIKKDIDDLAGKWKMQLAVAVLGLVCLIGINLINYRFLGSFSYWVFFIGLISLGMLLFSKYVVTLPFAEPKKGSYRWLDFNITGMPNIQPSEFFKIIYILTLAWYLRYRSNYRNFKALIVPFTMTVIPMGMILLEPDLGTAMLMMPVLFMMLFIAGAKGRHLLLIILLAVMVSPFLWHKMESYQRKRVSVVVLQSEWVQDQAVKYPWLGEILVGTKFTKSQLKSDWAYHLIRSKYSIASGGLTGYGFRMGPFIKYDFLGERHNDFIFAVIAEQWGFRGALVLFGLYIIITACGLKIAANNTDPFGRLLTVGIIVMFVVEVIINVAMTMGIMPITGLTLPLVSYGGSSLVVNMICIGLMNNVGRCRPFSLAKTG